MTSDGELKRRLAYLLDQRASAIDMKRMTAVDARIADVTKQLKRVALNEDPKVHLAAIQKRLKWLKEKIGMYEFEYAGLTDEANALQDTLEQQKGCKE
jgi:archaellum component FlaC